ncbi:MAG TPA: single-stranded DNA-binding protein [Sphingobacteriaceae bacterium]
MSGVNKVILVGHLGRDPEIRHLENGTAVASFTLATSESYVKDGKRIEQTEWHNIVMWRGLADVASKYLQKGKQIYLEGKLRTRSYEDREKVKRYVTEIVADNFTMLGRRPDGEPHENQQAYQPTKQEEPVDFENSPDDDLPF